MGIDGKMDGKYSEMCTQKHHFTCLNFIKFLFSTPSQKALAWDTYSQGLFPDICIVNDVASRLVTH